MKLNSNLAEVTKNAVEVLNSADNKPEAITQAIEMIVSAKNEELIQRTTEEARKAAADVEYAKSLGLRNLSAEAKKFYAYIKNPKNTITVDQADIIPTDIVDYTLIDVKKQSGLLSYVNFAPANVKKWISASKYGTAAWGALTDALTSELSATITSMNMELAKLHVLLLVPKAIRELSDQFVDRYFSAVLAEVMVDGLEDGVLNGSGSDEPIGYYNTVATGHAARTLASTFTGFSPKQMAPVKKHLSNGGKREVSEIILVCNPADEADYVAPALYDKVGNMISSFKNLKVVSTPNNTQGQAAFILPKSYTMGLNGIQVKEYKETKAIDDVDVIIGKAYANGRPVDDYSSYVFDVTKLVEFVPSSNVNVVNTTAAPVNTKEVAV